MSLPSCASRSLSCASRLRPTLTSTTTFSNPHRSVSTVISRREKRHLRNTYPRPDKQFRAVYPVVPPLFENKITQADGSVFYITTASPRISHNLVRDCTNHHLWNPSLARESAALDQSGRAGRFSRRYARVEENVGQDVPAAAGAGAGASEGAGEVDAKAVVVEEVVRAKTGYDESDLDWMSGETAQSVSGIGKATNIKGMKKKGKGKR